MWQMFVKTVKTCKTSTNQFGLEWCSTLQITELKIQLIETGLRVYYVGFMCNMQCSMSNTMLRNTSGTQIRKSIMCERIMTNTEHIWQTEIRWKKRKHFQLLIFSILENLKHLPDQWNPLIDKSSLIGDHDPI